MYHRVSFIFKMIEDFPLKVVLEAEVYVSEFSDFPSG